MTDLKRYIVCGGRDYSDRDFMYQKLNVLLEHDWNFVLVHGACRGADILAAEWGVAAGVIVEPHPADWKQYGKGAGMKRNKEMLDTGVDGIVAFPGGVGTAGMVNIARRASVPIWDLRDKNRRFSER